MRFSYQVGMCDADHYLPLAKAAEEAGYDGIAIPDSICYPEEASSKYPYNADGSREFLESVPFIESLIAVAAMAAVTEKVRFATFVYKLAVRQAPVVAKQVQGIQALSGNRFDFGIGISPWEEDFAVCGTPWEKRGKRFDEQIEILRGLESGDEVVLAVVRRETRSWRWPVFMFSSMTVIAYVASLIVYQGGRLLGFE